MTGRASAETFRTLGGVNPATSPSLPPLDQCSACPGLSALSATRWPRRTGHGERRTLAWSLALVAGVETGIILVTLSLRWEPAQTTPDLPAMTVVFSPAAEPAPPEPVAPALSNPPEEPASPPAADTPLVAEVPRLAPLPAVRPPSALPRTAPQHQRPRERLPPAEPPRPGQDAPQATPPVTAPAAPPGPSAGAVAAFDALLRQAVQAAVRYPAAAQMMGLAGRARVAFDYRDSTVSAVRLEQSAGSPLLDVAALAAVRSAHYPAPPQALAGQVLSRRLWVDLQPGGE